MHDFNENHIQELKEKWKPVLEHPDQAEITDPYRKAGNCRSFGKY